jgi:hypothetical protein
MFNAVGYILKDLTCSDDEEASGAEEEDEVATGLRALSKY